jgi:hypothetical protein
LCAAGALIYLGGQHLVPAFCAGVFAAVAADTIWFELERVAPLKSFASCAIGCAGTQPRKLAATECNPRRTISNEADTPCDSAAEFLAAAARLAWFGNCRTRRH